MLIGDIFCTHFHIEGATITIVCDGLSTLNRNLVWNSPPSSTIPDYDLIMAIQRLQHQSMVKFFLHHVHGHQDVDTPLQDLNLYACLNIRMDQAAKALWHHTTGNYPYPS